MSVRFCWLSSKMKPRDSRSGVRGLSNYCLSCCVNSLLQNFSATWELAELLDKWEAAGVRRDDRNVPFHLKKCLTAMRSDVPQPAPHHDFLHCLDRNSICLNVQNDADEVFLSILNSTLLHMDDRHLALEIQNLYKISTETFLQCLECGCTKTQSSYLLNLPLHIKEVHNSLEGCLKSFFDHHELRGINCCFCPTCGKKTPSKQGLKLLSLPHILCVNLKRFRNSAVGTRKLDCKVTFPETFDFSEVVKEAFSSDFSQNVSKYTLYAVVVHSGYAMFGHYTAYVRHRGDQRWYHADDSHVVQVSWEDVKSTYGGRDGFIFKCPHCGTNAGNIFTIITLIRRSQNTPAQPLGENDTAYMLMYRRGPNEEGQPEMST